MKNNTALNYDQVWENFSIQNPKLRYTWKLVRQFEGKPCLEIGCGNNPLIPLKNGYFFDTSKTAVNNLKRAGLKAFQGTTEKLPFKNNFFHLVVAWHVMEHVKKDQKAFTEISRVLKRESYFLLSTPIWMDKFTEFDKIVGHERRYEPDELMETLKKNNLKIIKYKADKRLFGRLFTKLLSPLVTKLNQNKPHHSLHIPKQIISPGVQISRLMEKRFTTNWKRGKPHNLASADNLVVYCQKIK